MTHFFNLTPTPPKAVKKPTYHHGLEEKRQDDYHWMKDENWPAVMSNPSTLSPDIRAHLDRENAYTQAVMENGQSLISEIFEDMKSRIEPADSGVPDPDGEYAYYHRYRENDQHGLYVRTRTNPGTREAKTDEQIILDAESLAQNTSGYFDLGSLAHSPNHQRLAYTVDDNGSENYEIYVGDIHGPHHPIQINNCDGTVLWGADNATLFWVERDENHRPYVVLCQNMDDLNTPPKLVYQEKDPGYFVGLHLSDGRQFIVISAHNHTTSELHLIKAHAPLEPPYCLSPRQEGREYSLHEHGEHFYCLTNSHGATDFQIMRCPIKAPTDHWEPFIAHKAGCLILAIATYKNYLVRLERENALPRIVIRDMHTHREHEITFDEPAYALGLMGGFEYDTDWLRFSYSSPTTPESIFDYNMKTRERVLRKTQRVPSGHQAKDYKTERLMLPARDGEMIPVTLLYRADSPPNPDQPLWLYGYGSYGITITARFRTSILSLVDRGFTYAIAHVRGGMAKGYQWYLDGKLEHKSRTFSDFIDVAQGLCDNEKTRPGRIIAHGGSAGGLLVGAATNMRADLFGGVVAAVPFVDVLTTMSDDTLPLTPPEWPEWGNPLIDPQAYASIKSYSPYDNVKHKAYPPMLITGGLTDPRVTYWEPTKWVAKLRTHQSGRAPILLKMNMSAGHQGEAGRYDSLKETAFEYAFALMTRQYWASPTI